MRKTVVIKVSYDTDDVSYQKIEQALYDSDVEDVDLLEEYED